MNKLFLFLILAFLVACSRMDILLALSDRLFVSELDDYFDLTSEQSRRTRKDFTQILDQVRTDLFRPVADRIEKLAQNIDDNSLTEKQISEDFDWSLGLVKKISVEFEKPTHDFLTSLTPDQISYFEKKSMSKLEDNFEKHDSPEKIEQLDLKKFDKWISYTVEELTKDQEKKLKEFVQKNPFPHKERLTNQKKIIQTWIEKLRTKSELKSFVTSWIHEREKIDSKEYLEAKKTYQDKLKKFIYELYLSLSSEQKKTLVENLRFRAKEFREHAL